MPWGVAAAAIGAAGGIASAAMSDDGGRTSTSRSTSQRELPDWLEQGSRSALDLAQQISQDRYDAEEAQNAMGLTGLGHSAIQDAISFQGSYMPQLTQAQSFLADASDELYRNANLDQYVNPYIDNVLNNAADDLSEAYQQKLNAMDASAVEVGAFGGMRAALRDDMATESYLESVSDLYTQGLAQAYNTAAQRFAADRSYMRGLVGQYATLAELGAALRSQQMQNKLAAGTLKRNIQANLYTEARDFAENERLQPILATLTSVPYGASTSTQGVSVAPDRGDVNPWVQGLGGAISAYGAYNQFFGDDGGGTEPVGMPFGQSSQMYVPPTG